MSAFRASRILNASVSTYGQSVARTKVTPRYSLHVRPWDGFSTPAHVFAIVRELEKRFGPVKTITTPQSLDGTPGGYHSFAWFEFEEPLPLHNEKLMSEMQHLVVEKPNVAIRPGGIGLDDLAGLLERGERQDRSQWAAVMDTIDGDTRPVIDVRLELGSPGLKLYRKPRFRRGLKISQVAESFAAFPGFSTEPTIEMQAVQSLWKTKMTRHSTQSSSVDSKDDQSPVIDPLAGYTDTPSDAKLELSTSSSLLATKTVAHAPPLPSAPSPVMVSSEPPSATSATEPAPSSAPIQSFSNSPPDLPQEHLTSTSEVSGTKQATKKTKMLSFARESALKEVKLMRERELEQLRAKAARRKAHTEQNKPTGEDKNEPPNNGFFSFLRRKT
ncbi:hypothetical protein FRB94_000636 [Tulasnella sp. JGI-2019a]|nr:hypothetical protein FRB93_011988 [Tulasnella sp. JGI-2019a]KAG9006542.1 hypothetical protein FRB94_000636 [Tulasnella sp. JGI-2019a]KAG9032880.1 hypothetical protein FRB95_000895 [Tulasnella sp. JGI-2019a]